MDPPAATKCTVVDLRAGNAPPTSGRRVLLPILLLAAIAGVGLLSAADGALAQSDAPVHLVTISGEIDLGLAPYLERVVTEAETDGAAAVILDIDTPGGRLDAVLEMRDTLLDSPVRTIAFVNRSAFSAGALIALASQEIVFAPGASMGAATPVDIGTGAPADAKVISAVRSTFRATADARGRDPLVGEAMVDPAVAIEGLVDAGQLLTLTEDEAEEYGYLDDVATDLDALLAATGLEGHDIIDAQPRLAERVVRLLTHPVLGSVLLTVGVLLIIAEIFAGAFGIASLIGAGLLGSFFYGHLLAGLAGWEDVVLVGLGVALILVEVIVVPGFGVPGVLGLAGVLGGGFLAMTYRDFDFVSSGQILSTASTIAITFLVITIGLVALLTILSRRGLTRRSTTVGSTDASSDVASGRGTTGRRGWLRWFGDGDVLASEDDDAQSASGEGAVGVALSDLRPAGVADFDGHRVDVVTEGDYLAAGDRVEVIHAERYRRVVRRARD